MDEKDEIAVRREERRQRTAERVLDAARDLFSEKGFDHTTIDDIAASAHVSRGTVFNYFESKDAILTAMHGIHMDKLPGIVDNLLAQELTTTARLRALFFDVVDASTRLGRYLKVVTRELDRDLATPEANIARTERFVVAFSRVLEAGVARGEVRTDYPVRFLAQMVMAVYITSIRLWRQDPDFEMESEFEYAAAFIAEAVTPRT